MFSVIVMRSRDYMDSPELSHLDSLKKFFFIYLFLVALSVVVHRLSPSCGKQGLLSGCMLRLLITVASLVANNSL